MRLISCEKAAIICNKKQYKEATFREKLALSWHLLVCKICAQFSKSNKKLTELCNQAPLQVLSNEQKLKLKREINSRLSS